MLSGLTKWREMGEGRREETDNEKRGKGVKEGIRWRERE